MHNLKKILDHKELKASSPCRIDFAGTLDIPSFLFPMSGYLPVTFNMAINLRTKVTLKAHNADYIKVSSAGFEDAEFKAKAAPYNHPLGLIFAIADSFDVSGVHIIIESESPPRSALGGSSVASVALVALIMKALYPQSKILSKDTALQAHLIEAAVAGVPCGLQDHLAAAFGGVNAWHWKDITSWPEYRHTTLVRTNEYGSIKDCFLLAYTGRTHNSHAVNNMWREQFISGKFRNNWVKICELSHSFCNSFIEKDFVTVAEIVKKEVKLRLEMTPDVLDDDGRLLVQSADAEGCGARFTGAGGGGCIWAVGPYDRIKKLKKRWEKDLSNIKDGRVIDIKPEPYGILFEK